MKYKFITWMMIAGVVGLFILAPGMFADLLTKLQEAIVLFFQKLAENNK